MAKLLAVVKTTPSHTHTHTHKKGSLSILSKQSCKLNEDLLHLYGKKQKGLWQKKRYFNFSALADESIGSKVTTQYPYVKPKAAHSSKK